MAGSDNPGIYHERRSSEPEETPGVQLDDGGDEYGELMSLPRRTRTAAVDKDELNLALTQEQERQNVSESWQEEPKFWDWLLTECNRLGKSVKSSTQQIFQFYLN